MKSANARSIDRFVWLASLAFLLMSPFSHAQSPADQLRQFLVAEWDRTMEQNPSWASQLGDRRWNDKWEDISLANLEKNQAHLKEALTRLQKISRDALPANDRLNYDLFKYETDLAIEDFQNLNHLVALNQREGIQLADELGDALRFETVKDYEDWIARLHRLPALVDQNIALLREGIRQKRVQPKITMQRVPGQIDKQITATPHASPFFKPFHEFPAAIGAADRDRMIAAAKETIRADVVPAYQRFKEFFTQEYLTACLDKPGDWQWPCLDKTYAFICRKFTTTRMSPNEIHETGLREVQRIGDQMRAIMRQVGFQGTMQEFFQHLRTDPRFYCKSSSELFSEYRATAKRIDPLLVKIFKTLPRMPYGVEPVPDKVAPDTTAAYYRLPAADGSRAGSYFVNLYKPEMRPRYEMMALSLHEAVPGHHLQFALQFEQGDLPSFRRYGGEKAYTAYVEGWALYAESLGDEMGLYDDPYTKFGQLTYEMWRAVRLVVDTGIHAFQWDRQKAIDYFLANAAKTELDVINEIDRYISWPGQALAYKIGELKIKELRARAKARLGDKFDVREFHDLILKSGAIPLEILDKNVDEWVASKR